MTRLARGDAAMGAGILATNSAAIGRRLRDLRAVLDDWLAIVEGGEPSAIDAAALEARLQRVRRLAGAAVTDRDADPGAADG